MLLLLIGLGFVFILAIMVFFINPPEAWLKKVFYSTPRRQSQEADRKEPEGKL